MSKKCCGTCKLWDREKAKDAAGRIRKDRPARCLWKSIEVYPVALSYGSNRPTAGYSSKDAGADCACWEPA